jgi:hypothetical protein
MLAVGMTAWQPVAFPAGDCSIERCPRSYCRGFTVISRPSATWSAMIVTPRQRPFSCCNLTRESAAALAVYESSIGSYLAVGLGAMARKQTAGQHQV